MRKLALVALAAISMSPMALVAQTAEPTYYMRNHLTGQRMKATVRQQVTHPYWGCLPNKPDGFNLDYYSYLNPDVVEAMGESEAAVYSHYVQYGRAEGRRPCDPRGGTDFLPTDTFSRTAPRNGTVSYVATVGEDTYDMGSYWATDSRITIDGFDVERDRLRVVGVEAFAGEPQFEDMGGNLGTRVIWGGVVRLVLVSIPVDQARAIVEAARRGA